VSHICWNTDAFVETDALRAALGLSYERSTAINRVTL